MLEYFMILAVVFLLILASIRDIKYREVPNWMSYSLIFLVISLRVLQAINRKDINLIVWLSVVFVLSSFIGIYIFFEKFKWGGADVKIMIGMMTLFGTGGYDLAWSFAAYFITVSFLYIGGYASWLYYHKRTWRRMNLPFVPTFLASALITIMFPLQYLPMGS